MLSKKTRYAMLAMTELARRYGEGPVPIGSIAEQERIPRRFLEGILLALKNNGYLDSTRGKTGGYFLSRPPEEVSLAEIVTLFEGSVGMLNCVCENVYQPCEFCKDESDCKIRYTFRKVHDSTAAILKNTSLKDLV